MYESFNYPNHYVRHQSSRIKISLEDNSKQLHEDASFIESKGSEQHKSLIFD